ncbi:F0F1 ATP synthase subunit B [Tateyamaria sp. ANG-S1]|uniref:F0F1 ATP synthase subunit B n=1 Tax=Tateyamaria sp. ANG-S1 TaxID=1577905 RepID=UPI00057C9A22|nr:F0F1 ATP synthase subunit B [Tateyamaria sp. ANG-S1]KIC51963.1 ATP F0F1 synthase subunit B [Tateyamaria sp. ANG-S1]
MRFLTLTSMSVLAAGPALAASKNPFSAEFWKLSNTDLIVLIAFILFIGVLFYFKVPGMIGKMLDDRASGIQSEIDEARALREEAQTLLASYERKQKEVQAQADKIVEQAKKDAEAAADQARADLKTSIERRMAAATDQIASAEASAVKEVRDTAAAVAVQAARDVIAKQMTATDGNKLIDDAIAEVDARLH